MSHTPTRTDTTFEPAQVSVRVKLAVLWTSMLLVFAYVDLFSLYRPDNRADLAAGKLGGFTVNQAFLLGTTIYVVIPALMVSCAVILRPRVNRIVNTVVSSVYALTIVVGAIGEWGYYILGSAVEVALLAAIVHYAWNWPTRREPAHEDAPDAIAQMAQLDGSGPTEALVDSAGRVGW